MKARKRNWDSEIKKMKEGKFKRKSESKRPTFIHGEKRGEYFRKLGATVHLLFDVLVHIISCSISEFFTTVVQQCFCGGGSNPTQRISPLGWVNENGL